MKILIAILTCHRFRDRADVLRETWAKDVKGADVRFFLGVGPQERDDEVILPVDDGYNSLPAKIKAICEWARARAYEFIFKADDDCYVVPERLLKSGFENYDYTGRLRGPSGIFPAPYCSGFGYWLSARALAIVADAKLNGDNAEDRFVANVLFENGIRPKHDPRYVVIQSRKHSRSATEAPRTGNNVIAACEFSPADMRRIHGEYIGKLPSQVPKPRPLPPGALSRVCVVIKTFMRDGLLLRCINGIECMMPEVKIIVVDDGWESAHKISLYAQLRERGHICNWLPFDSGFGAKGNDAIMFCDRPYVLIGSDDFDFTPGEVRKGIERMQAVLDHDPTMHIASGRLNGRPYESCFEIADHSVRERAGHRETRMITDKQVGFVTYYPCDLTVNYSLIRRECLGPTALHWDGGDVKIGGGEHGAFFLDAQRLGYGVCVVEGAAVGEMPWNFSLVHPSYPQYRRRSNAPGRPCLKARGVDRWTLQDGTCEVT